MRALAAIPLGFAAFISLAVHAQTYPSKPIRLVDPWPAGSGTEAPSRIIATKLGDALGQPVYIDNRGGASGTIGSASVTLDAADGYTLILGNSASHGSSKAVFPNLSYDPVEDFTPITLLYKNPLVLIANKDLPVSTLPELIKYAKERPAALSYGTPGYGTPHMLAFEVLKTRAGLNILHVPYKGGGPAINDLLGGHIQLSVSAISLAYPMHKGGRAKALAVTGRERQGSMPDVPTMDELYPGIDYAGWCGLFGPKNLPAQIVKQLNATVREVMALSDLKASFEAVGLAPSPSTPDELKLRVKDEVERWQDLRRRGIKLN